jgi:hypothetical protein
MAELTAFALICFMRFGEDVWVIPPAVRLAIEQCDRHFATAEQCEAAAHKIRSSNPDRDLNDLVDPKGVYVAASCEPEKKASGSGH